MAIIKAFLSGIFAIHIALKTKNKTFNNKGYTLIEIIIVIVIMTVSVTIVVPLFIGYSERARIQVCTTNCLQLERMYKTYLMLENINHSDAVFTYYLQEYGQNICPSGGTITYNDGKVLCDMHPKDNVIESDDEENESIPFL